MLGAIALKITLFIDILSFALLRNISQRQRPFFAILFIVADLCAFAFFSTLLRRFINFLEADIV